MMSNKKFYGGPGGGFSKEPPGRRRHKNDIAVIGVSARTAFADNVDEFWRNLIEGKDCIHEIPDNRQEDIDNYFPYLFRIKLDAAGKKNKKRYLSAAYLKEVDKFDYRFFRLSPKEASLMDPCQRLFMETAYEVLEDAGYAGKKALECETGVYVGYSDDAKLNYFQMVTQVEPGSIALAIAGNLSSIVPGRISYFMDLKGPSLLVDTACSSSLVAVHLACQAIRNGDCEQAIAGGVRVNLMPIAHTAKVGIESSDGKTKTFDDDSDGTGVGEGVGAVLLKPLDKALEDRDHIYAVIKGSAVNQDGQSLGITAPSADAQERLLVKAWKNAGVDPETISYIEAHGTGTRVGDPIELEGIIHAFKQFTNKKQFCGIGSVKTNIGHLFEGSGIFGFIKAVLALKHRTLPPVLHFRRPNRNIAFEESPVYVVDELTPWKTDGFPLRCGVTAFGFSGTNCHVVLEEAPVVEQPPHQPGNSHGYPFILVLSAKSKESLLQLAKRYRDFLAVNHDEEFIDICYTAGTGRQHLNHRLAVIAKNTTELLELIKSFCGGSGAPRRGEPKRQCDLPYTLYAVRSEQCSLPQFYYGEHRIVQEGGGGEIEAANGKIRDFVETGRRDIRLLHEICELYIRGVDLEWGDFYKGLPVKRVPLPVYPFERKRCWLDIPPFEENVAKPLEGKLFFDMEWIEEELKPGQIVERETSGIIIVIKDENGVGEEVARSLRQGGRQVLEIMLGDSFSVLGNDCYQIDGSEAHYEKLFLMLEEKPIDRIIFMATLARKVPVTSLKRLQQSQMMGAYNLFHLTKMLLKHYSTEKIEYVVIADFANKVTGKEKKLKPENAPLLGLAYAIDRECENFSAWCIDIDDTVKFDQIMAEIRAGKQYRAAAYRENRRYIERFIPIDIEDIEDSKIEIKNSGVYLITGGTGGIGLEMGKYLASKTKGVNIALVNRSKMPDRDRWEDILDEEADKRTVQKIKAIKEIEAMGADVCLFSADCSGFRQMKQVLAELRERFGKINGIIHGAGVEGEGLLVRKSEKKFTNVLNPKVAGTWILDRLTKDDDLDFLVLFSTVATFLMNPGQTDYTAANAYLDTFSEYRNRQGKKTLVVNWVTWKETGMAVNFNANFDIIFKAIPTAQAVGAFDVVLNKKVNRVLIGELNLDSKLINLLKNAQFRLAAPIRNIIDAPDTPLKAQSADEQRKKVRKVKLTGREDGTYTKSELLVAKVWGEVLGFDGLRIDDNFYELGGDSILATQVVNRINTENNLKISLIEIFNYETIKDLAKYVESLQQF